MTERDLARVTAVIAVVALAVLVPSVSLSIAGGPASEVWWTVSQAVGYLVVVVAFVRAATGAGSPRWGATLLVALVAVGLVTYPLVTAAAPTEPWVGHMAPTAAGLAALGWRGWMALFPAGLVATLVGALQTTRHWGEQTWVQGAEDAVFVLALAVVSVVAVGAVRTAAGQVELAASTATDEVVSAEERTSAALARAHWAGVLHDDVLAVLAGVTADRAPDQGARDAAARALVLLQRPPRSEGTWSAGDLVQQLAETVQRTSSAAETSLSVDPGPLPSAAALAILAATTEAVRNVVRHAGTHGRCHVEVRASSELVEVAVTDDGAGFRGSGTRSGRLGLRVAVRDRMRAVGGSASWSSSPGQGTRVTIRWPEGGP